jgi:hypothetical protein
MDLDSGAQLQLTGGSEEQWPQISADEVGLLQFVG